MTGIFLKLRRWHSRSRASEAFTEDHPTTLIGHLRSFPDEAPRIARRALAQWEARGYWVAIQSGIALVHAGSDEGMEVWRTILGGSVNPAEPVQPFARITPPDAALVDEFLGQRLGGAECHAFWLRLRAEQRIKLRRLPGQPGFREFVERLSREGEPIADLHAQIAQQIHDLVFKEQDAAPGVLPDLQWLIEHWAESEVEAPLDLSTALSFHPEYQPSHDLLAIFLEKAAKFVSPDFVDDLLSRQPNGNAHARTEKRIAIYASTSHYVLKVASLARRFCDKEWVPQLMKIAFDLYAVSSELSRRSNRASVPNNIKAAAGAALTALGVCSAKDGTYRELHEPEESGQMEAVSTRLSDLIDRYNAQVTSYKSSARPLAPNQREALAASIGALDDEIAAAQQELHTLVRKHRLSYCPGSLLLHVLCQVPHLDPFLKQGSAWGLARLAEQGKLTEQSRDRIWHAVYQSLGDKAIGKLVQNLEGWAKNEDSKVVLRNLAWDYLHDRSQERLRRRLAELAPHLRAQEEKTPPSPAAEEVTEAPEFAEASKFAEALESPVAPEETPTSPEDSIAATLTAFRLTGRSTDFEERHVLFFPEQRVLELEDTLREGLEWIARLVAPLRNESGAAADLFKDLRSVVRALTEHVPGALTFFSHYPLRLMTLDRHAHRLGVYRNEGCSVALWTRFSPPAWEPGVANPGEVDARYLVVDDHSSPNAIGIYYQLFRHPALAVPVIYHEFLHYGGPTGDGDKGIRNETEVLLREMIFARKLVAALAPPEDNELSHYEKTILRQADECEYTGFVTSLLQPIDESTIPEICDHVRDIYHGEMAPESARTKVEELLQTENRGIEIQNMSPQVRNWYPDIPWPIFDSPETEVEAREFRRITYAHLTASHHFDSREWSSVRDEPIVREMIDSWEKYCSRPNAGNYFKRSDFAGNTSRQLITRFRQIYEQLNAELSGGDDQGRLSTGLGSIYHAIARLLEERGEA